MVSAIPDPRPGFAHGNSDPQKSHATYYRIRDGSKFPACLGSVLVLVRLKCTTEIKTLKVVRFILGVLIDLFQNTLRTCDGKQVINVKFATSVDLSNALKTSNSFCYSTRAQLFLRNQRSQNSIQGEGS